jgi:hydrogenase nickel incorporation protein HypA/HybF
MHEVGLMQDALEIAETWARRSGAARIHRVGMRVGIQSGVVPEALEFAFEALAPGTMAEGARLDIEPVPVVCHCAACESEFVPEGPFYICPLCGGLSADVRAGRELEVATLEVE